jgi:hypothetical protein
VCLYSLYVKMICVCVGLCSLEPCRAIFYLLLFSSLNNSLVICKEQGSIVVC